MPVALRFVEPDTVSVHASGRVTFQEVEGVLGDLLLDPRLSGARMLIDCSAVHSTLSTPELREVARDLRPLLDRGLGPIAIIATSAFMYGVARMFSVFAGITGASVGAFRSEAEALIWLSEHASAVT
jgi:hypothetical protein